MDDSLGIRKPHYHRHLLINPFSTSIIDPPITYEAHRPPLTTHSTVLLGLSTPLFRLVITPTASLTPSKLTVHASSVAHATRAGSSGGESVLSYLWTHHE